MTAVVLNGASSPADPGHALCTQVEHQLAAQFDAVRSFHLAGYDIGHCMGEFDCFVKTPGRCRIHDEGQEIERAVHDAELVVLVTPLRYGGYAAPLKKAVDRLLPLISPFFRKAGDMTHHAMRYEHRACWVAVALDETPLMELVERDERARLFRAFAETNALNFGSPAWGAAVVGGDRTTWPAAIASALATPTARARPLRVAGMLPEGADAVTVVFDDPARHAEHFEAGQVLTLEATIDGERVRRAYSLASAPCDGGLAITVKRVPGGLMSNWIHDQLSVGELVRCFGPTGDFTAGPPPAQEHRRLLLIAGGSGIVPLQAVARQVLHDEPDAEITLVYGSSALERAIFAAPLQQQALRDAPRWRLHWVFETAPPEPPEGTGPACSVGRLDAPTLSALLGDTDVRSFHRAMVCGPDAMRAAVRQALLAGGLSHRPVPLSPAVNPTRGPTHDPTPADP